MSQDAASNKSTLFHSFYIDLYQVPYLFDIKGLTEVLAIV